MLVFLRFATVGLVALSFGPALAQSPTEGPLAARTSKPEPDTSKSKAVAHHKAQRTAHHKADGEGKNAAYTVDAPAQNRALPRDVRDGTPDDPLSLGMKWNGNNDNARDTRVQNYNGGASGTGAEVGLKLHF